MVNTSLEYRKALYEDKRSFIPKVNILLSNGTVLELSGSQIMQGGAKIDDGVSSPGSFDIGSAVIGKLTLNINNMQDEYSDYNFTDAIVTVFVGLQLESRIEWLKKGVFSADDPTSTQSIITLECLDNMAKFDKQYDGKLIFPANLQTIVNYCCSKCGVILNTNQFDNYTYRVNKSPFEANEPVTYREILSYCAQIAGCYARCNVDGRLELKWYDTTAFDITDTLDGGNFTDYLAVDAVDGGNYTDYSATDVIDGGTFEDLKKYHHIYSLSSINISTDDVVITGISVTASDGKNSKGEEVSGETVLSGDAGYVLKLENNPLIECGMASNVASYLGAKIRGMRFRPMNISALSDPSIEAGDCAVITNRKNNSYYCYITNLTYTMGGYESFSCYAETPSRNSSERYSQMTKAVIEARKNAQKQLSQYDLVAQQFGTLMANGMGLYRTTEEKDGALIYYMHNQPLLKDSKTIWKMTEGAFSVSTDGGLNWNAGIDKDGNVLATVLTAIGINADWIKAGVITGIEINNGNGTFKVDSNGNTITNNLQAFNARITGGNIQLEGSIEGKTPSQLVIKDKHGEASLYSDGIVYKDENSNDSFYLTSFGAKGFSFFADEFGVELTDNGYYEAPIGEKVYGIIISEPWKGGYIERVRISQNGIMIKDPNDNQTNSISIKKEGSVTCNSLVVRNGNKSKCVETSNYGDRLLYCYETPSPLFGDIGRAVLDNTGTCYIYLEDVFSETIDFDYAYNVFTQKYGQGDLWVSELQPLYFVIKGTPGMEFAWEVKAKQVGHGMDRLEAYSIQPETKTFDYADEAVKYMKEYEKELLNYE